MGNPTAMFLLLSEMFAQAASIDDVMHRHPSAVALAGWVIGILSYHQDVKHPNWRFGALSQLFAAICLIALIVFGFTHREWTDFVLATVLVYLHIRFTKRWKAHPGAWW